MVVITCTLMGWLESSYSAINHHQITHHHTINKTVHYLPYEFQVIINQAYVPFDRQSYTFVLSVQNLGILTGPER